MKRMYGIAVAGLVLLGGITLSGLMAEKSPEASGPSLDEVRAITLPVAKALMGTLEGRLVEAMGKGGPVAAINVCQEQALALTEMVRQEKEIAYLKRVGVRIRNPENAPGPAERRALDHFLRNGGKEGAYPSDWVDTVKLPDGSEQIRYYKAISTQGRCLACHGPEAQMPAAIREAIDARYPDDGARGFQQGELRGLLVVGLEAEALAVP